MRILYYLRPSTEYIYRRGLLHDRVTVFVTLFVQCVGSFSFRIRWVSNGLGGLSSSAVVGALDPPHDCDSQLLAAIPGLLIEHVLLEE